MSPYFLLLAEITTEVSASRETNMKPKYINKWIHAQCTRKKVLLLMKMPLTANQIGLKLNMNSAKCSRILQDFSIKGLAICLNPGARMSRLYDLTAQGRQCQEQICIELNIPLKTIHKISADWGLYGWICFRHRSSVIKILTEPMQPSEMKRKLLRRDSSVNISSNNIRDIIKLFKIRGIVTKVYDKKKVHPLYELSDTGKKLYKLLIMEKTVTN